MTKKEVNQQNLSTSFKLKLVKKPQAAWNDKKRVGQGLYSKLSQNNANKMTYNSGSFTLQDVEKAFGELLQNQTKERKVKIITNQAGVDLFNKALLEEQLKKVKENEYRKKLSFRSKIFKQTYKFG